MKLEENNRLGVLRLVGMLGIVALLAIGLSACSGTATEVPPTDTPEPPPDYSVQEAAYASGPHSADYDLGRGPNDMCGRCHSPQNWRPGSTTGIPPAACVSCKFATDDEVRDASPYNILIPEDEWVGIPCETCHSYDGDTITGIAWLNPITGEHEPANTSNEICAKCHVDAGSVDHEITLGGTAHTNYAGQWPQGPRPQYCSDCHDPMSTVNMACEDCHTTILSDEEHINGMNAMHTNVTCMACHDASGYDAGPHTDEAMGGLWVPQETTTSRGTTSTSDMVSHSPQLDVSCTRCHFADNTNDLVVLTADGEVPPEPTPTPEPTEDPEEEAED